MKASQIKQGTVVEFEGKYFKVLKASHSHIGRGKANVEMQMKNILTGQNLTRGFKADEDVGDIEIEKKQLEFAYKKNNELYFFTDANDGKKDKLTLNDTLGEHSLFLKKGIKVVGIFIDDEFLSVELPVKETYKVVSAPPNIRGNTAQGGGKVIEIDSGATLSVPFFVKEGDEIVVNIETGEYVSRANF
ncbi:MAG: hypothetical protein AAB371_00955 [Patescibacteria group bacterium]